MANFALLNEQNEIVNILYLEDSYITNAEGIKQENLGISYLQQNHPELNGTWVECSQANGFRRNSGAIGFTYNSTLNAFIPPKPEGFSSWQLNETTFNWEAPVAKQPGQEYYHWNEETQSWVQPT